MKLKQRIPSGRAKDETEIELLSRLREKLHSENVSTARLAAFNLSWKQEDGLDIRENRCRRLCRAYHVRL